MTTPGHAQPWRVHVCACAATCTRATWLVPPSSNSWSQMSGKLLALPTSSASFSWDVCSPFFGVTNSRLRFFWPYLKPFFPLIPSKPGQQVDS